MSTVPGQDAKDKGNAAFKSGDFPAAIGHYTAAILADSKNPTYTLNRAAAYLKLGKKEDAERDCDATIKLDQKNVKAWFRRGQARSGQEKFEEAKEDFKRTLQLDSKNEAAKQELTKIESLLHYRAANAGKKRVPIDVTTSGPSSSSQPPAAPTTVGAKRRRVPIKIVDSSESEASPSATGSSILASTAASSSTSPDELMKPVSTRTLSPSSTTPTTYTARPPPAKATSFKDLKQARDTVKQSPATNTPPTSPPSPSPPKARVGGGIFRPNGQHKIFEMRSQEDSMPKAAASAASSPASESTPAPNAMRAAKNSSSSLSLFEFNRAWNALNSPQDRWMFLVKTIHPTALPSVFKTSLEAPLLVSMLETFKAVLENSPDPDAKEEVKTFLLNMARVPRFSTIVLFMSKDERRLVKEVWDGVSVGDDQIEKGARKVWGVS